jgi:hypothetical protein
MYKVRFGWSTGYAPLSKFACLAFIIYVPWIRLVATTRFARLGTTTLWLADASSADTRIGPYLCRPSCSQHIKFVIRLSLLVMARPKAFKADSKSGSEAYH